MMTLDIDTIAAKFAGVLGALVSMRFLAGTWPERVSFAACGSALSFYSAEYVASRLGIPEGLAGFLLGLFGMAVISRAWEFVQTTPLSILWDTFIEWLRLRAGLPKKDGK